MLPFPEYQISNGGVALQVLANSERSTQAFAVAVVPGLSETAEDWRGLLGQAFPVPAAALTLRGRGASGQPVSGYTVAEHASDITAFVNHFSAGSVLLVAFSRSVAYALEYAISRPPKLAGLVLLDYPPRHTSLRPGWSESFAQSTWRGRIAGGTVPLSVLQAIEREADAKDYTNHLSSIEVPVLIVQGGARGAALSATDLAAYETNLPSCKTVVMEDSAHALWEPSPTKLYKVIMQFAREVAAGEA
ncbi:alpha/beta fold hydrolase [Rhodoferax sp.]|uniref:alpha/beta fold hydrolase n=1 Tax=Rhodoferax sp. TaxID=50421 RepID=UPI002759ED4E|nr:alpha/beta hydrolase [Rhodoferax sp.]